MYRKKLKVSTPEGKSIYAKVDSNYLNIRIEIEYIKEVEEDDKLPTVKPGIIVYMVPHKLYAVTITQLEAYLESLFLNSMKEDKNVKGNNPGNEIGANKRTGTGADTARKKKPIQKRDTSSIRSGPGGSEPSQDSGSGSAEVTLAEGSDSEDNGKD